MSLKKTEQRVYIERSHGRKQNAHADLNSAVIVLARVTETEKAIWAIVPRVDQFPVREPNWEDRPMTLEEKVHRLRLHVIRRAEVRSSVPAERAARDLSRPFLSL